MNHKQNVTFGDAIASLVESALKDKLKLTPCQRRRIAEVFNDDKVLSMVRVALPPKSEDDSDLEGDSDNA